MPARAFNNRLTTAGGLDVVDAEVLAVLCDDILGIDVASERRVRILVVVEDKAVGSVLAVNHGVLQIPVSGVRTIGIRSPSHLVGAQLDLLAMMAQTAVAEPGVVPWEQLHLIVLVGSIHRPLDGLVRPGDGAVTHSVGPM